VKNFVRSALLAALVLCTSLSAVVHATAQEASLNGQDGDNRSHTTQSGSGTSGDSDAGQIVGAVSAGKTSVDATNSTDHADISTGDARGTNDERTLTGQNVSDISFVANETDIVSIFSLNLQEGDNKTNAVQLADTTSGDGVGGQVIGVVTSAGGSSAVTAANTSKDVDVSTGDARSTNEGATFAGQNFSFFTGIGAFLADAVALGPAPNLQEGDNTVNTAQTATAASGDGVAGQVLGVVSAGDSSVDATNLSQNVDLQSGDARANNEAATFAGQDLSAILDLEAADVFNLSLAANVQEGNNRANPTQTATSTSGDVVGGEVAGIVTSAGGSADVVLANTSTNADADTGDSRFNNSSRLLVGQVASVFVFV
jgi:hypothetical protein